MFMAGEEDDEFSFPTTTCSPPRFIGSPRLWRSSSSSLYLDHQIKLTKQEHELTSKDRNYVLTYIKRKDGEGNSENMDVIWEDLNYEEEICAFSEMMEWEKKEKEYDELRVTCGGGKRPSMVVLVNLLKKLLLLQRTPPRWTDKRLTNNRSKRQ